MVLSSLEPCASSASIADSVSSGQRPKATLDALQISVQAALIASGRPWPPNASGPDTAFQPAAVQRWYASGQPGAVVTLSASSLMPCSSPTRLSGASTSEANRPASSSTAVVMSASKSP